jgi:hypothetical protein
MGCKNAKKMDGSEGLRWEEVGGDESVGVVAFQVTQQRKLNFMHLHFDLGVKRFPGCSAGRVNPHQLESKQLILP